MRVNTVGSVCSGIEAASVAWEPLGFSFKWFSEIAEFPSRVLSQKYPSVPNIGDMQEIPNKILAGEIESPDLICGGTPCQAFSLAGWKNGLNDDRGNLTLKFVDIIKANDLHRKKNGKSKSIVFWENVEGVLTDKTNAFGCMISSLAGFSEIINIDKWSKSGVIYGPERNIAWRVLDAKYFGVPQQRKRLYLIAGGKDFNPEKVLFEKYMGTLPSYPSTPLTFEKDGHSYEIFREYTDCLYSAYGTKWNGNAAATNGSLFVVQDGRIRRLSPLECERLMGIPDNYTDLHGAKKTNRYQAVGNSWAVPVIEWIGKRLLEYDNSDIAIDTGDIGVQIRTTDIEGKGVFVDLGQNVICLNNGVSINCTDIPCQMKVSKMFDIVSADAPEDIYISPVGCYGIIRRKNERNQNINPRLEQALLQISSQMTPEEIEKRSRVQKRGQYSSDEIISSIVKNSEKTYAQLSLFE